MLIITSWYVVNVWVWNSALLVYCTTVLLLLRYSWFRCDLREFSWESDFTVPDPNDNLAFHLKGEEGEIPAGKSRKWVFIWAPSGSLACILLGLSAASEPKTDLGLANWQDVTEMSATEMLFIICQVEIKQQSYWSGIHAAIWKWCGKIQEAGTVCLLERELKTVETEQEVS